MSARTVGDVKGCTDTAATARSDSFDGAGAMIVRSALGNAEWATYSGNVLSRTIKTVLTVRLVHR